MQNALSAFIYVGIGGALGALLRYWISLALQHYALVFPYGTLAANLVGCSIIGVIAELTEATDTLSPQARLFLATGFCGGLTTLSSMIFELTRLLRDDEQWLAFLYFSATFMGALLSFFLGVLAVKLVVK